ncbi:MAE_28990/MAE_18760 family HEPN-like nuclease [Microcoleus sp. bin38.metabat.b11b12b14.051]|uniref:MAE_28990/MAE_18760 family HEPN-like nuclease n=1 Tax=Microcoleus sp. bin38.metabat.b11b12b14.051 TaxID=2742709 RepID=UPI0025E09372|nr:MAE_28990/MAE_18760 family HEPN-like nuclease [Microcoleus sp. bin38.metabat.b11b12b14.051]
MFEEILEKASVKISTVRAIVKTNDRLRKIVFQDSSNIKQLTENPETAPLIEEIPSKWEWEIYDRSAVVTRLYAIYERFVKDLISDWLRRMPDLVPRYSDLEEKIQNTHREGIGRLLIDIKKNRFQHLSVEKVVQGLSCGITDTGKYELLPDAFLLHEQNLRKEVLETVLKNAGIDEAWRWIINHKEIKYFLEEVRGSQNTAEGELKQLVDYRNEAAHGSTDQILGTQELLDLGDFVEALCKSLADLVTYNIIVHQKNIGRVSEIGKITEWFKNPQAGVAKVKEVTLTVGEDVYLVLVNDKLSYCYSVKIESIQLNNISHNCVAITSEAEVGLKFDRDARVDLTIYVTTSDRVD